VLSTGSAVHRGAGLASEVLSQPKRKWQSPNSTHATETGYPGQLPADGGGGTSEGTPGSQIPGRAHSHRAYPAASESSAVKLKSVGGGTD